MKTSVTITVVVVQEKGFRRYVKQCASRGTCIFIILTQQGGQFEIVFP